MWERRHEEQRRSRGRRRARTSPPRRSDGREAAAALGRHQHDGDERQRHARRPRRCPAARPRRTPATTGTAADSSAVIGATTLIWPDRQPLVEEPDAGRPAEAAQPRRSRGRPPSGRPPTNSVDTTSSARPSRCDQSSDGGGRDPAGRHAAAEVADAVGGRREEGEEGGHAGVSTGPRAARTRSSFVADEGGAVVAFGMQLPIQSQSTIFVQPWEPAAGRRPSWCRSPRPARPPASTTWRCATTSPSRPTRPRR